MKTPPPEKGVCGSTAVVTSGAFQHEEGTMYEDSCVEKEKRV